MNGSVPPLVQSPLLVIWRCVLAWQLGGVEGRVAVTQVFLTVMREALLR